MTEITRRQLRHDILGCLNSIKLGIEAAQISTTPEQVTMFLDAAELEIDKAQGLVDEVLLEREPPRHMTLVE